MRILITTTYYLPNLSGITIYIKILAEELVKNGHQVTILTSWHDKKTLRQEVVNGVEIKRKKILFYLGKGPICPGFLASSIKEILKSQIVNCHLPEVESLWVALWARLLGKKVVLTHHTDLSFWKGIKNKIIDSGVFGCQFLSAMLSDKVISYTKDYAKHSYLLKHFLKKTKAIYPPIKFEIRKNSKLEEKIKNKVKNKKYVVGFCGRIAKQKGIEVLIKSTKILDKKLKGNYVILLAGPKKIIGEKYYEYLQKKYKDVLKNRFVFLDNIKRKDLSVFYKQLDLLSLPSDDILESFGWVQIEAMRCGVPCVATNLPGMRVPVKKTSFGELFENKNEKDLSRKIIKVLRNGKEFYKKRAKNLDSFDYQKSIEKYEVLFKGLVN